MTASNEWISLSEATDRFGFTLAQLFRLRYMGSIEVHPENRGLARVSSIETYIARLASQNESNAHIGAVEQHDFVNHPPHYTQHPSGIECITVTEHFNFSIGNAIKYLWRAGLKGNALEDLKKARWYIDREIQRVQSNKGATNGK